jgi:hypothetical protein
VREFDHFGDCFCTCALIIWTVPLHRPGLRLEEGGRAGWWCCPAAGPRGADGPAGGEREWASCLDLEKGKRKFPLMIYLLKGNCKIFKKGEWGRFK